MVWRRQITVDGLQAAARNHDAIAERYGTVVAYNVPGKALALPEAEARKEAARLMHDNRDTQLCSAVLVEGEGLVAMASRGIISAIQTLSRVEYPLEVFATHEEAAHWCSTFFDASPVWVADLIDVARSAAASLDSD